MCQERNVLTWIGLLQEINLFFRTFHFCEICSHRPTDILSKGSFTHDKFNDLMILFALAS